jgi:hypothetical protein
LETDKEPSAESSAHAETADRLERALADALLPAWRKAYLSQLAAAGRRFSAAGNARGADHCFAKIEEALHKLPIPSAEAQAAGAASASVRAVDRVRRQWRLDRVMHAEKVLADHGARLSPLENRTYRESLERLRQEADRPSPAANADAGLLDLRRRLYQRVLRAQRLSLARRRAAPSTTISPPVRRTATPSAWQPVTGPYNDRSNLEELLAAVGAIDPAWVEEFLELYGKLDGLNALIGAAGAGKR